MIKKYKEFISSVQKKNNQIGFDYFYRKISYPLSFLLYRIGFSANSISIISIALTIFAAILISNGIFFGYFLFMFSYLLDFCDGNIARLNQNAPRSFKNKKIGLLLENLNSNVFLLFFIFSLSAYINPFFSMNSVLMFTLFVISLKLIFRYTLLHASVIDSSNNEKNTENNKIKNVNDLTFTKMFFSKFFFTPSFSIIFFIVTSAFFSEYILVCFFGYYSLDVFWGMLRFFRCFR